MKKLFLASSFYQVADKLQALVPESKGLKVAFIPTAADVYEETPWMDADREKLVAMGFIVEDYDIKNDGDSDDDNNTDHHNDRGSRIYNDLKGFDVIFVSGGNTFYLLYHIRQSGFDKAITRLIDEGKVYIGSSAGSMIMGESIEPAQPLDNANEAPKLASFRGLGFVDFVLLPHYGKEKYEERYQSIIAAWSNIFNLQPLTDNQVVVIEGELIKIL